VPVLLEDFSVRLAGGEVEVLWIANAAAPADEFRLTGSDAHAEWEVAFRSVGPGRFRAADRPAPRPAGHAITYTLRHRGLTGVWTRLARETVSIESPSATRFLDVNPNPCNPSTEIAFALTRPGRVHVAIFDLAGREVAVLADRTFASGRQTVAWDGRDVAGRAVSSGTYIARLETSETTAARKLMLVR
jgi:hypothetical protein